MPKHNGAQQYLGHYDTQLHLHDKGHHDVHDLYRRLRGLLDAYSRPGHERIAMGEIHLYEWPDWIRHWTAYYGARLDELHLPLNFTLVGLPWNAQRFKRAVDEVEAALPDGAWPNLVLGSHDEPRVASRVGPDAARAAMLLLLTLRGTPILYYGDEIGMRNVAVAPERAQDPFGKLDGSLGRDGERTPMQWSAAANAGFCPAGLDRWLPLSEDFAAVNAVRQRSQRGSLLQLTRQLLAARRSLPALRRGAYEPVEQGDECFAYVRAGSGESLLVALNFTPEQQLVRLPRDSRGQVIVSTDPARTHEAAASELRLRAHEACLMRLSTGDRTPPTGRGVIEH